MGTIALSAAFLSIAAQSAASADVNPHAENAMNRAAQFAPNEERNFDRQRNTSERGHLISWVVNTTDRPIKFNGLIGDAVLRNGGGAPSAFNATPIQAAPFTPPRVPTLRGIPFLPR
ncbi:hypothetical protein ACFFHJ_22150 [Planotetraspora thailandica]|nr:hypothetical protein [Planotetraspora thailandica]